MNAQLAILQDDRLAKNGRPVHQMIQAMQGARYGQVQITIDAAIDQKKKLRLT